MVSNDGLMSVKLGLWLDHGLTRGEPQVVHGAGRITFSGCKVPFHFWVSAACWSLSGWDCLSVGGLDPGEDDGGPMWWHPMVGFCSLICFIFNSPFCKQNQQMNEIAKWGFSLLHPSYMVGLAGWLVWVTERMAGPLHSSYLVAAWLIHSWVCIWLCQTLLESLMGWMLSSYFAAPLTPKQFEFVLQFLH